MRTGWARAATIAGCVVAGVAVPFGLARSVEASATGYRAEPEAILKLIEAGDVSGAVDRVEGFFREQGGDRPAMAGQHKDSLNRALANNGPLHGHVLVSEKKLADRYVMVDYLLLGEKRPLHIGFMYYRPVNEWRFAGWRYDNEAGKLLTSECPAATPDTRP